MTAVLLAACHGHVANAPRVGDGPCEMVAAMLAVDDRAYQDLYRGASCGGEARARIVVAVNAPADVFPAGTRCDGRAFEVFDHDPNLTGTIVKLDIGHDGEQINFMASLDDPNGTPTPDGGFEVAEHYCHAVGGYAELRDGQWRTFVDVDRALSGPRTRAR